VCWAEIGPHYDSRLRNCDSAGQYCRTLRKALKFGMPKLAASTASKALARAGIRRDHEAAVKLE